MLTGQLDRLDRRRDEHFASMQDEKSVDGRFIARVCYCSCVHMDPCEISKHCVQQGDKKLNFVSLLAVECRWGELRGTRFCHLLQRSDEHISSPRHNLNPFRT